jgi:hypothetical protein
MRRSARCCRHRDYASSYHLLRRAAGQGASIAYQASKWAVRGMTRFAARELAARNVRVSSIAPGFIDTPIVQPATDQRRVSAICRTPLGRLGEVVDVPAAVLRLASDDSRFVTGTKFGGRRRHHGLSPATLSAYHMKSFKRATVRGSGRSYLESARRKIRIAAKCHA